MQRLKFWFVYASTYSYLSVSRITRLAAERQVPVDWQPFSLLPIFAERGMEKGPFLPYPDKLDYMWRDLERRAARHRLEYKRPTIYPPTSRLTSRIGVLAASEGWCREFTEAVFRLHWTEGRYIGTDDNLEAALASVGKDLKSTVATASDPKMDSMVDEQVAKAKELRFSAPLPSQLEPSCFGAMTALRRRSNGLPRRRSTREVRPNPLQGLPAVSTKLFVLTHFIA